MLRLWPNLCMNQLFYSQNNIRYECHLYKITVINLNLSLSQMIEDMEILFNEQQLAHIDLIIDSNMNSFFDGLISNQVELLLRKEIDSFRQIQSHLQICGNNFVAENQIAICDLFNQLVKQKHEEHKQLQSIIRKREIQNATLASSIESKESIMQRLNLANQELKKNIIQEIDQHQRTKRTVYGLKEELIKERDIFEKQKSQHVKQDFEQRLQIQHYIQEIKRMKQQKQKIQHQNECLISQKYNIQREFNQIYQQMQDDLQKNKTNLMTLTILFHQMTEKYQDFVNYFTKTIKIHQQNKEIVSILLNINYNLNYNLIGIERQDYKDLNSQQSTSSIFDSFSHELNNIQSSIRNYSNKIDSSLIEIKAKDKLIIKQNQQINHLTKSELKLQQQMTQTIFLNQKVNQELKFFKQTNHKMLIDSHNTITRLQQKLQEYEENIKVQKQNSQLLSTQIINKSKEYEINLNSLVKEYTKQKQLQQRQIQEFRKELKIEQHQNQSLIKQLKQSERKYTQLNQAFINTKGNLQIIIKTQSDDDNTNFSLLQQLIDKNTSIVQELTSKKLQYDTLKQQKQCIQIEIAQIKLALSQSSNRQQNLIMDLNNQNQINQKISQQIIQLNEVIKQLRQNQIIKQQIISGLQAALVDKIFSQQRTSQTYDQQSQTDQNISGWPECKIRKQNIMNKSVKSEIQKSHSLLSERQQNKQNVREQNCNKQKGNHLQNNHKLKLKVHNEVNNYSCKSYCEHKQKIVMLNQIINYMINHVKGYCNEGVRACSWLNCQIVRQGTDYERKISQPSNMMKKIHCIRRISQLCSKQAGCNNLISDFENIMNYYFNICQQATLNNFEKQKLGKTINKFRKSQDSQFC